jgi:hypothetical protein
MQLAASAIKNWLRLAAAVAYKLYPSGRQSHAFVPAWPPVACNMTVLA